MDRIIAVIRGLGVAGLVVVVCNPTCGAGCNSDFPALSDGAAGTSGSDVGTPGRAPDLAGSCSDRVQNGSETSLDCGGTCAPCANGGGCTRGSDCRTGNCDQGHCWPQSPIAFSTQSLDLSGSEQTQVFMSIAAGDIDSDGFSDLVLSELHGNLVLAYGDGHGVFLKAPPLAAAAGGQIALGDFNGDGRLDIAYSAGQPGNSVGRLQLLLNEGQRNFKAPLIISSGVFGAVAAADINGDGHLDLAAAGLTEGGLELFAGKGDGTFLAPMSLTGEGAQSVVVGDFNQDGREDVGFSGADSVVVFFADGMGGFLAGRSALSARNLLGMASGDINGDGSVDLVVAQQGAFGASLLVGGGGWFGAPLLAPLDGAPQFVVTADLDADGKSDAVVATTRLASDNTATSRLEVLFGGADPNTSPRWSTTLHPRPLGVASGDFNSDGRLDLATITVGPVVTLYFQVEP